MDSSLLGATSYTLIVIFRDHLKNSIEKNSIEQRPREGSALVAGRGMSDLVKKNHSVLPDVEELRGLPCS